MNRTSWALLGLGLVILGLCWLSPIDAAVPLVIGAAFTLAGAIGLCVPGRRPPVARAGLSDFVGAPASAERD